MILSTDKVFDSANVFHDNLIFHHNKRYEDSVFCGKISTSLVSTPDIVVGLLLQAQPLIFSSPPEGMVSFVYSLGQMGY